MPNNNESTMKWKVDVTQLKAAMQEAKRAISVANAEFKTATAGMDKWSKSTEGLEAKLKQLNDLLPQQRKVLAVLEAQYEQTAKNMGENSSAAQELRIKIEEQRATIVKTETNINKYNSQLQKMEEAQKESETAIGKLTKSIADQQDKVDALKKAYKDSLVGNNAEETARLAKELKEASEELVEMKKQMHDADKAADELDASLQDVSDTANDSGSGFTVMKGALADLISHGIQAAIGAMKELARTAVDAYKQFDEGEDNVIRATGATGEAAEKLAASYKKVTKSVVGDMGTIGSALGEVNTRFGFTGEALEDATVQFMKFADITGSDAVSAVQLVSRAMGDAGIESSDYAKVLDDLAIAAQASGITVDKLAENLTKYGAPMRALGMDTKEAIAIFAQWEKAGVNTEIAFSGMRQAIGKWSKEGKDAKVEFKKMLDEIAATPDIASATTKAIEVFGQKAGADLADAIKGGRFEYSEFLDLLEGSAGTVTNTYEETQDGFDKVNLAIQGAKAEMGSYVGNLVKKYQPQIESFIKQSVKGMQRLIEKGTQAVKWIVTNGETVMAVIKSIAVGFATYKAVNIITSVVGAFKTLFAAIKAGEGIMKALNLTMAANPYALVAAGIAGLITLYMSYAKKAKDAQMAQYQLNAEQKESIDKAHEMAEAYGELNQARDEQMRHVNAEFGYITDLKNEYNGLIDSNGKVKDGYEDRANFILNELAKAMGTEVSDIQKLIDQNGKLGEAIDDIIKKKQAEALLSANEQMYTDAIRNRSDALNALTDAQLVLSEKEAIYQETSKKSQDVLDEYNRLLREAPASAEEYLSANGLILQANGEAKKAYEEAKKGVDEATNAWVGYNSTIQNYEGLASAIISGDVDKINEAMKNMQYGFITAETGNRESLERQVENYQKNVDNLERAIRNGTPNVTQEMLDQAKSMVDAANKELDKLPPEASETGEEAGKNFADGISAEKEDAKSAGEELAEKAKEGAESVDAGTSGENFTKGFAGGMKRKGVLSTLISSAAGLAGTAITALRNALGEKSPSRKARMSGINFGKGLIVGMTSMFSEVGETAADMANSMIEGLDGTIPDMSGSINDLKSSVASANASMSSPTGASVGSFAADGRSNVQNVTFNQTINSPKAVDRLTLYRETNSMLFAAKVRINNV